MPTTPPARRLHGADEITLRRELHHIDIGNRGRNSSRFFVRAITRKLAGASPDELAKAIERWSCRGSTGQYSDPVRTLRSRAKELPNGSACRQISGKNLGQIYERWDGKRIAARPASSGEPAVKFSGSVGSPSLRDAIALTESPRLRDDERQRSKKRAGGGYEVELAELFLAHCEQLMSGPWDGPVDRETISCQSSLCLTRCSMEGDCEEAYLAIADMIDMRMPFTFGHSRAVAALAAAAGQAHGATCCRHSRRSVWAALHARHRRTGHHPVSTWMRAGAPSRNAKTDARAAFIPIMGGGVRSCHWEVMESRSRRSFLRHHERLRWDRLSPVRKGERSLTCLPVSLPRPRLFRRQERPRPYRSALNDGRRRVPGSAVLSGREKLCPPRRFEAVLARRRFNPCQARIRPSGCPGLTPAAKIEVLRLICGREYGKKRQARQARYRAENGPITISRAFIPRSASPRAPPPPSNALERGLVPGRNVLAGIGNPPHVLAGDVLQQSRRMSRAPGGWPANRGRLPWSGTIHKVGVHWRTRTGPAFGDGHCQRGTVARLVVDDINGAGRPAGEKSRSMPGGRRKRSNSVCRSQGRPSFVQYDKVDVDLWRHLSVRRAQAIKERRGRQGSRSSTSTPSSMKARSAIHSSSCTGPSGPAQQCRSR